MKRYVNETSYTSSKQQRFYELFCHTNCRGNSLKIFPVPFTRKVISVACKGLDSWLVWGSQPEEWLSSLAKGWLVSTKALLGSLGWSSKPFFFSQIWRVCWVRKNNMVAGHLWSHIRYVPLSLFLLSLHNLKIFINAWKFSRAHLTNEEKERVNVVLGSTFKKSVHCYDWE